MIESDREAFGQSMTQLFAVYSAELTSATLDAWWGVLAGYSLREVQFAMSMHVEDRDRGRFRPVPADVLHHLTVTLPAKRRARRNEAIRAVREKMAPLEHELYDLRAKLDHGTVPPEDEPRVRARLNGLQMQIGALAREGRLAELDAPRIDPAPGAALANIAAHLPELPHADS